MSPLEEYILLHGTRIAERKIRSAQSLQAQEVQRLVKMLVSPVRKVRWWLGQTDDSQHSLRSIADQ